MNWFIIISVGIAVIALIVFLMVRNQKDEKIFEKQLNDNYPKTKHQEDDSPVGDEKK